MWVRAMNNASLKSSKRKNEVKTIELEGDSLYIFGPENVFRKTLAVVSLNPYFENLIMWMIGLNSMLLFLDTPILVDAYKKETVGYIPVTSLLGRGDLLVALILAKVQ